jgi:cytoplasmic tRNA 2-thiolation protein 1
MYAYEKEIVLYAHHRRLTYFSTECIYSPEAFRGSARALIKDLERVRPEAILDLGRAGAVLGACVPGAEAGKEEVGEVVGACGKGGIISGVVAEEPAVKVDANNDEEKNELETEVTLASLGRISLASKDSILEKQPSSKDQAATTPLQSKNGRRRKQNFPPLSKKSLVPGQQTMGQCIRCGYLTSQDVCKACVLLEGLNRNRPKVGIGISVSGDDETRGVGRRKLAGEAVLEVS